MIFEPAVLASTEDIRALAGWIGTIAMGVSVVAAVVTDLHRRAQLTFAERDAEDRETDELDAKW